MHVGIEDDVIELSLALASVQDETLEVCTRLIRELGELAVVDNNAGRLDDLAAALAGLAAVALATMQVRKRLAARRASLRRDSVRLQNLRTRESDQLAEATRRAERARREADAAPVTERGTNEDAD